MKQPKAKPHNRLAGVPDDVVIAPQAEAPRGGKGHDSSKQKSSFRELSWTEFDGFVQKLARKIHKQYNPDVVVGVAHGGVFVGGALAAALALEFYPVRISRRSRDHQSKTVPKMFGKMPKELGGRNVLLVDDVAASGETLKLAQSLILKAGAVRVETACLLRRPSGYAPRFTSIVSSKLHIFPWDYEPVVDGRRFETSRVP